MELSDAEYARSLTESPAIPRSQLPQVQSPPAHVRVSTNRKSAFTQKKWKKMRPTFGVKLTNIIRGMDQKTGAYRTTDAEAFVVTIRVVRFLTSYPDSLKSLLRRTYYAWKPTTCWLERHPTPETSPQIYSGVRGYFSNRTEGKTVNKRKDNTLVELMLVGAAARRVHLQKKKSEASQEALQ